jgi:nucleoside-diphosphate kinase
MENLQRTLVLIKPDGVQRGLIGEIIKRFEDRGLQLIAMELRIVSKEFAEKHYASHVGKKFYNGLIKYITSSPIIAMVWEGSNAVEAIRQTIGSTNPIEASPGTIRHDLAIITSRNLVHASDSSDTAKKEISLWFDKEEVYPWNRLHEDWFTGFN